MQKKGHALAVIFKKKHCFYLVTKAISKHKIHTAELWMSKFIFISIRDLLKLTSKSVSVHCQPF